MQTLNKTMENAYIVQGGNVLKGDLKLSGAKNVALKVIIAALLFDNEVRLRNIPKIQDVYELLHLIRLMGGKADFEEENTVVVDGKNVKTEIVDLLHGSKIRVSFMLFAPLLYKFRKAEIPNPGGCRIGARPIDRIVEGMRSLGVVVQYDSSTGYYSAVMSKDPEGTYTFAKLSHTGTELMILLAVKSKKTVIINNAALEPEIDDLISFLNESGAHITRSGSSIQIIGSPTLRQSKAFEIICDRNEAATYISLALSTGGEITVYPLQKNLISAFADTLKKANVEVQELENDRWFFTRKNGLKAVSIETVPYPGFMTDWQPSWAILMTQAQGYSMIVERVFENRFMYVDELKKLGAEIVYYNKKITNPSEYFFFNFDKEKKYTQAIQIKGTTHLHNGVLTISDLRAGATLVIAALVAQGESVISGASIVERGYENFVEKVRKLGGIIQKV